MENSKTEISKTTLGSLLHNQRESLKLSLDAVHKRTRIAVQFLEALEQGRYEVFPAEVYLVGFLKQYAKFLGVDTEKAIALYREQKQGSQQPQTDREREQATATAKPQGLPPTVPHEESAPKGRGPLIVLIVLILIFLGIFWSRIIQGRAGSQESAVPAPKANEQTVGQTPPAPNNPVVQNKLVLEAFSRVSNWLRIVADGKLVFEGILPQGAKQTWEAKDSFVVRSGYVEGVELTFNGKPVDLNSKAKDHIAEVTLKGE